MNDVQPPATVPNVGAPVTAIPPDPCVPPLWMEPAASGARWRRLVSIALIVAAIILLGGLIAGSFGNARIGELFGNLLAEQRAYGALLVVAVAAAALALLAARSSPVFIASLIRTAIWLPGIVSIATVLLFLLLVTSSAAPTAPATPMEASHAGFNAILFGVTIGLLAWLAYSFANPYFSFARGANARVFTDLTTRLWSYSLSDCADPNRTRVICELLKGEHSRWVLGVGYLQAWEMLHRAEEDGLAHSSVPNLIDAAFRDALRLSGSNVPQRDLLVETLWRAVLRLDADSAIYLPPRLSAAQKAEVTALGDAVGDAEQVARGMIRRVRATLNEYREDRWEKIVRARNQLLAVIVFTGLVAYLGLATALLAGVPREAVLIASVYYIIGASVGLLPRLRTSAAKTVAVEDYGLATARLIQAPLLSGVAGLAGVVLTGITGHLLLQSVGVASGTDVLAPLFTLDLKTLSSGFLAAAIFGLSPALLLERLQGEIDKYKSDLEHTKSSGSLPADGGTGEPS